MKADAARKSRILIVEDEPDIARHICSNLRNAGFEVSIATDGLEAIKLAHEFVPALMVLDLMLPGMSGLEVYKHLKRDPVTSRIAIVILSAKAEELDRILGLELGADDYMTKPFSPRELILRVKAILRMLAPKHVPSESLKVGDIEIDRPRFEVRVAGHLIDLTATEFRLLTLLAERCGRLQSRDALLDEVWGYEAEVETRTVDTHVRRLRDKLGKAANYIETIRSFGYRMIDANET